MSEKKLSEEARLARNEYYRRWRSEHRDKVSAANRRYREKHKTEITDSFNRFWEKKAAESKMRDHID